MSAKLSDQDDLQKKKDKASFKNSTSLQKHISKNKNQIEKLSVPKQPVLVITSPSKNKLYQHVGPKVKSNLPISVAKKTSDLHGTAQKETADKNLEKEITNKHITEPQSLSASLSSSSSSEDDDEELNRLNEMLERFRSNKPTPTNYRIQPEEKHVKETHSEEFMSKSNENDIESLKHRLNNLRQKLFTNFDHNDLDNNSENEINKSNDSLKKKFVQERPPIRPKLTPAASNQPVILETNNKFTSSNKSTKANPQASVNIESIDLKAKQLIDKSESSLTEKFISSEGLSSSSRSCSSIMSTLSSNFQETQPYKPEFLKYLENRTKPGYSAETGESLKPEEDILYQWRLRRKLEEAKKMSSSNSDYSTKQDLIQSKTTNIDASASVKSSNLPTKQSMQTQTNNMCDSSVQTSLESLSLQPLSDKKLSLLEKVIEIEDDEKEDAYESEKSLNFEKPTKDTSSLNRALLEDNRKSDEFKNINETRKYELKKIERSLKTSSSAGSNNQSNFFSSSPVRTKSSYLIQPNQNDFNLVSSNSLKSFTNMSADLTRVSSLNENTHVSFPKVCNSPISFNQSKLVKKPPSTASTSAASSMTTVTASIETRSTPNPLNQTVLIRSDNSNKNFQNKTIDQDKSSFINDTNLESFVENTDETSFIQKEMVESDEILRILLKKTYYYRLKLKQIDELLTT